MFIFKNARATYATLYLMYYGKNLNDESVVLTKMYPTPYPTPITHFDPTTFRKHFTKMTRNIYLDYFNSCFDCPMISV